MMRKETLKINEIFESLQGEGRYAGLPVLFVRLSGCTRKCSFCDTRYHTASTEMTVEKLIDRIESSKTLTTVFTGGEPLLQLPLIRRVIISLKERDTRFFHLESNADLVKTIDDLYTLDSLFDYLCFSPKTKEAAENIHSLLFKPWYNLEKADCDIKVVTDLDTVGVELLPYATTVMPLSVYKEWKDLKINRRVWDYCTKEKIRFCPRLHAWLHGMKRGV